MRNLTNLKMSHTEMLSKNQMLQIRGGCNDNAKDKFDDDDKDDKKLLKDAAKDLSDDKRRQRPGGGVSTQ